jgi:hypothetical protein
LSPSDVEWGKTLALVKELDHKLRNLRQIVDGMDEELGQVALELQKQKVQSRTALSIIGFFASALAWFFR